MNTRTLGRGGLDVSPLGLGCMGLSFGLGPATEKSAAIGVIRSAVEHSVTLFDTAEGYGPYVNEELVGEALEPVRDQVLVCTKFGFKINENGRDTNMKTRKLGTVTVSELGFGKMSFASVYGTAPDREESIVVIRGAYDLGVTFFA